MCDIYLYNHRKIHQKLYLKYNTYQLYFHKYCDNSLINPEKFSLTLSTLIFRQLVSVRKKK